MRGLGCTKYNEMEVALRKFFTQDGSDKCEEHNRLEKELGDERIKSAKERI